MINKVTEEKDSLKATVQTNEGYSLQWLDLLVHCTLNPKKNEVEKISGQDGLELKRRLREETLKVRSLIQQQFFSLHSEDEAKFLIRNYHATLTMLLSQSFSNLENIPGKKGEAYNIILELLRLFEELILMIENRFSIFLSLDEYVPRTYFRLAQQELSGRLKKLQRKVAADSLQKAAFEIVVKKMNRFLNGNEFEYSTSYKNISYRKKLISEIEKIDFDKELLQPFTMLDAVLIYMNFNSREYINCLVSFIQNKISICATTEEKAKELYYLYKSFNQLHKKPDTVYNQQFTSIELRMNNWFTEEITYFEKIIAANLAVLAQQHQPPESSPSVQAKNQKVFCRLSTDQLGLILRAADEEKIVIARSMNAVFKTIVPHLSTSAKENLSPDSMRSKAYAAEERDKKYAISALEKLISKIKTY